MNRAVDGRAGWDRPRRTSNLGTKFSTILDDVLALDVTDTPILAIVKPVLLFIAGEQSRRPTVSAKRLPTRTRGSRPRSLAMRARFAENSGDVVAVRADTAAAIARYESVGDEVGLGVGPAARCRAARYDGDLSGASTIDQGAPAVRRPMPPERSRSMTGCTSCCGFRTCTARLGDVGCGAQLRRGRVGDGNSIGSAEWRALTAVLRGGVLRA